MEKICTICSKAYTQERQRNRKGRCIECRNATERKRWEVKRIALGKEVFAFKKLLAQGLKKCTHCNVIKEVSNFSKSNKTGLRPSCKACDAIHYKKYEALNKDRINENRRNRRKDPISGIIFAQRDRQRSLFKNSDKKKYKAATALIRKWLGCSVKECMFYLEGKFTTGMTWRNRGVGEKYWQIDHIIPVSKTELHDNGEMMGTTLNRKIWHYTNLQPLWHIDNAKKSDKYESTIKISVAS